MKQAPVSLSDFRTFRTQNIQTWQLIQKQKLSGYKLW